LTQDLYEIGKKPHLFYSGHHRVVFYSTVSLVAGIRDRPARGETFFIGIHSHVFGKRHRYCMYHDENTKIMSCRTCNLLRIRRLQTQTLYEYENMGTSGHSTSRSTGYKCTRCADLNYLVEGILDIDISYIESRTKRKDFVYPMSVVPGSPTPPLPVKSVLFSKPCVLLNFGKQGRVTILAAGQTG